MQRNQCLGQKDLAKRWNISHRTLERWRYTGQGPAFLKLGGRVLYRQADIEAFEHSHLSRALAVSNAVDTASRRQERRLTAIPPAHPGGAFPSFTGPRGSISPRRA
jgi:hypothetical protein